MVIVAKDIKFAPTTATVPAGASVTLTLDNQDATVSHDLQVFGPGGNIVAQTAIAVGPNTRSTTFTLGAGSYPFRCSVHPREMTGVLVVQ